VLFKTVDVPCIVSVILWLRDYTADFVIVIVTWLLTHVRSFTIVKNCKCRWEHMSLTVSTSKIFSKRLNEVNQEMSEVMNWGLLFQTAGAAWQNALSANASFTRSCCRRLQQGRRHGLEPGWADHRKRINGRGAPKHCLPCPPWVWVCPPWIYNSGWSIMQ